MRFSDFWVCLRFVLSRERVQADIARQAQEALLEGSHVIEAMLAHQLNQHGVITSIADPEIALRMRRLSSSLFEHYGPRRRGSRLFILAKRRARLAALRDAASNLSAGLGTDYDDDRELA